MIKFLVISIALHLAGISLIPSDSPPVPQEGSAGAGTKDSTEKEGSANQNIKIRIIPKSDKGTKKIDCKEYYVGVGFRHDGSGEIIEIFRGYPAEKIDLRVGDWVVNLTDIDKNKVGEEMTIQILRNGKSIRKKVILEKICGTK